MHTTAMVRGMSIGMTTPAVFDAEEGGPPPGPITYVLDTFTGPQSAFGFVGHSPDVDLEGGGWQNTPNCFLRTDGSGKAWAEHGGSGMAYISAGPTRGRGVRVRTIVYQSSGSSVLMRFADVDNHFQFNVDSTQVALYKHEDGVVTQLARTDVECTFPAEVVCDITEDDHFACFVVNQVAVDADDSFNNDVGNYGLVDRPAGGTFDDFSVRSLP
jgi:hypothetical protein